MMRKNLLHSWFKTVVFSMMVLGLASCSGSSTQMTGDGIYGDLPDYLLKFIELKQKCTEDLEFEDNKEKQVEIVDKYAKQWEETLPASKLNDLCSSLMKDTIHVVSHVRESFSPVRMHADGLKVDFKDGVKNSPTIVIRYDEKPHNGNMYFFLDENDSIVCASVGMYLVNNTVALSLGFNDNAFKDKETADIFKLFLFLADKAKKIMIPEGKEEIAECVARWDYSIKATAKELEAEGIIGHLDLEDEKSTSQVNKEEEEKEDFTKPGAVDLAYFGLRGKVKSFQENGLNYTFSEKGKWETYDGRKLGDAFSEIKRDSENRIVHFVDGEFDDMMTVAIFYDGKTGWVSKLERSGGGEDAVTYTYDDKGYLVKEVCKGYLQEMGADEPTPVNTTTTYKYVNFDEHGNWTKREVKNSDGQAWEDVRTIRYYE